MDLFNVFVSRPTWLPENFSSGLQIFLSRLEDLGLRSRTIGVTDYPNRAPLDEVVDLLLECRGAVILGYPQIHIKAGTIKGKNASDVFLPTEWNHIEAALAHAYKLPLLVIHHFGVVRGVFDRGAINSFIYEDDLSQPDWSFRTDISGAVRHWRDQCLVKNDSERRQLAGEDVADSVVGGAHVLAKLIRLGRNQHCVRITNTGPEPARDVKVTFDSENDPIPPNERSAKLPIRVLPAGVDVDLVAAVTFGNAPPYDARLTWTDERGERDIEVPLT